MNLQELKSALETDARKRVDAQEQTIKELHAQITDQDAWIKALENRCYTLSHGSLCDVCIPERRHNCHAIKWKER